MKNLYKSFLLILSFAFALNSCTGGGGAGGTASSGSGNGLFSKTTTVSGTIFLSGAVATSTKPSSGGSYKVTAAGSQMDKVLAASGVKNAVLLPPLVNATVKLYNADRPDWVYPVAQVFTGATGTYFFNKLTNADLNLNASGQQEYSNGDPIPAGNYTVIAANDTTVSGGKQYVAVQAIVKKFEGKMEGNDLVVQDSDALPSVAFMLGLKPNQNGTFGGTGTIVAPNAGIQIIFSMAMARLSVIDAVKVYPTGSPSTPLSGTWKFSPDLLTATFYPAGGMEYSRAYTVKVAGGIGNVNAAVNVYGKPLPATVTATFTTDIKIDTTVPMAIMYQPFSMTDVPITTPIQIASKEEPLDINSMVVTAAPGTPSIGDKPAVHYVGKKQLLLGANNTPIEYYIYEIGHTPLQLGTDYVITVNYKDMAGNVPLYPVPFNFKTEITSNGITGGVNTALRSSQIAVKDVFGKWINAMNTRNATLLTAYMTGDFFWLVNGWSEDDLNRDGRLNLNEFRDMLAQSFDTYDYCDTSISGDISADTGITIDGSTASIVFTLTTTANKNTGDPECADSTRTMYADLKNINSAWLIYRGADSLPTPYPAALDVIELSAPGNGAQYPEPTVSQPLYPNFVWKAVSNVTTYAVVLMEAGSSDTGWVALVDGASIAAGDPLTFTYTPKTGYIDVGKTMYVLASGQSFGFTKFISKMKPGGLYHWAVLGFKTMTKEQIAGGADVVADLAASSATNNFSVLNNASPSVIATTPENGAVNVAVDVTVTAEFSEDMNPASFTANAFSLSDKAGNKVNCQVSYDATTKIASFTPAGLSHEELYTAMITTNVTDIAGNPLDVPYSWLFTTSDNTPPVTTAIPAGGLYASRQTVVLQTNEAGATITYTVDGTDPATNANAHSYGGPIEIASTTTLKFFATDASSNKETVKTETYTIDTTIPTTTANPPTGTYNTAKNVQLTCDDAGAKIYYTTNGTPPSTGSTVYSGLIPVTTEGVTVIQFFAKSVAGNSESIKSATYTIDLTAPDTTITSMPPDPTTSGTAQFTFTANEPGATFECALNGGSWASCESPKRYDVISQGTNSFAVRAKDVAGNTDPSPAVYTWKSDSTPPINTSILINGTAQYTTSASVMLTISATDTVTGVAQMQLSNDGEAWYDPVPYAASKSWTLPGSDGVKTVYVRFKDGAGNWSTPARDEITLDTARPDTTITRKPTTPTSNKVAIFEFTSSELASSFTCSIDSGPAASCTSPLTTTVTGTGGAGYSHNFSVYATDAAGNVDQSPATYTWIVSTDIIVTKATPAGGLYNTPQDVTLTTTGTVGTAITKYCFGAGCNAISGATYTTPIGITGTSILRFSTVDDRLSPEGVKEESYEIDTQAPSITSLSSSLTGSTTNSTNVTFTFTASEPAHFLCRIDGVDADATPCASPQTYSSLTGGAHTFYVKATDSAGNTGNASSIGWTIDLTAPTGTIKINNDARYSTNTLVNLSLTSPDPDVVSMQFSNDGFNWTIEEKFAQSRSGWTLTYGDGTKTVYVRFKDAVGNWSQSFNDSIILDTIAPNTTITSAPANPSTVDYAYFYFSSTETGSTFMCSIDYGPEGACSSPYKLISLSNGSHIFSVYAIDPATNRGPSVGYKWSVDTTGIWDTTGVWDQSTWGL